jgi:hypothetical protein
MRTFTLLFSALVLSTTALKAQVVSTFDDLALPHADTFYVNYSASGTDVGFNDGLAHFPCVYDTSFGGFWSSGFAYSNMTDSVTSGYTNQYSAKAGIGFDSSAEYVVAYGTQNMVKLRGAAIGHPVRGFYVTNNTYAYNSMRDGDAFARKFHNGDWFKLTVKGYRGGALQPDSVGVYLADFLFPDTTMNYILRDWTWVNTGSLGNTDSLQFTLTSTDNGAFGMNTPAYFCMDNFTDNNPTLSVTNILPVAAKVYPNPATNTLYVDLADNDIQQVAVMNIAGNIMSTTAVTQKQLVINTSTLPAGVYLLQLSGNGKTANTQFVKQ